MPVCWPLEVQILAVRDLLLGLLEEVIEIGLTGLFAIDG
jgi:hypothetical protein